jgi:hypothetical protein
LPFIRLVLLTALAAGVLRCSAGAAAVYDGFGYPANEDLSGKNGGGGWAAPWFNQGGAPTITTAGGLSFGNLALHPGAATTPAGNGITTYPRLFADPMGANNTTLFLSFCCGRSGDFRVLRRTESRRLLHREIRDARNDL